MSHRDDHQKTILDLLRSIGRLTARQIAERLAWSQSTTRSRLERMVAAGVVAKMVEGHADHVVTASGARGGWLDRSRAYYDIAPESAASARPG